MRSQDNYLNRLCPIIQYRYYIVDVVLLVKLSEIWEQNLVRVVFTYDVNCKYKINLYRRCQNNEYSPLPDKFLDRLHPNNDVLAFLVNAFHQNAHNPECADLHAIRNVSHVGRMAGEEVESPWAEFNKNQYSTREMDAGARRDTLDPHMDHHNRLKKEGLGSNFSNF